MSPLNADSTVKAILDTYPFPLAFVLKREVIEAATPHEQAEGLIRLATTALQYTALVTASNYAAAPFKDETISWSFERLKRPLVSDWAGFPQVAVPSLKQRNSLFVPELADTVVANAKTDRVFTLRMGEHNFEEPEMSLTEALVNLRNALAHDRYRGDWQKFVDCLEPLVFQFLQSMNWSAHYPLLRPLGGDRWARLMGAETSHAIQNIPAAAIAEMTRNQYNSESTGLLLADPTLSRFLALHPFIILSGCSYCEKEPLFGMTEEVFLFSGHERKKYPDYIGVRHSKPMRAPRDRLDAIYTEKEVPPKPIKISGLQYPDLRDRATRQSEIRLRENTVAQRYIKQVYFPRKEMEAQIEAFLSGRKTGFLLLGEAGMGKSNLLCRKVEEWSERGEIVLFYAGGQLSAETSLEERIIHDLQVVGSFPELQEFLRRTQRRLVLVLDGINEHENSAELLRHICNFTVRCSTSLAGAELSPTKVVFSFRSSAFDNVIQHLFGAGGQETSLFPSTTFETCVTEEEGHKIESYRFTLERVGKEELEVIYGLYRKYSGKPDYEGQVTRFCPQSSFADLSSAAQTILTHPWYLRMVMEIYNGKQIPVTLWKAEVLRRFCDLKIYGHSPEEQSRCEGRASMVDNLVRLMHRHERDHFFRDVLLGIPDWRTILQEREPSKSPYLQLVDEGVLMETSKTFITGIRTRTRYMLRFAFDPLFEYLLYESVLRDAHGWEGLTAARVVSLIESGISFDHLAEAVALLLREATHQRKSELIIGTLTGAVNLGLFASTLRCCDAVLGELQNLIKAGGHSISISFDSAVVLSLKGLALVNLQLYSEALAALDNSIAVFRLLSKSTDLRGSLAETLKSKGETLLARANSEMGSFLASCLADNQVVKKRDRVTQRAGQMISGLQALNCFDESIKLFREAVEEEEPSYEHSLAQALVGRGDAFRLLNQYNEGLACYEEAIVGLKRLLEGTVDPRATQSLIRTLVKTGRALPADRSAQAVEYFDEAIDLCKERAEFKMDMADAMRRKGDVLVHAGKMVEGLNLIGEASTIRKQEGAWLPDVIARELRATKLTKQLVRACTKRLQGLNWMISNTEDVVENSYNSATEAGQVGSTAELVELLLARFEIWRFGKNWKNAASDILLAIAYAKPFRKGDSYPEPLAEAWRSLLIQLRKLTVDEREKLDAALGDRASEIESLIGN